MKAKNIINKSGSTIAVFTRGDVFKINPDGTGQTGNWKMDPDRKLQEIIIYHRPNNATTADVFQAKMGFLDVRKIPSSAKSGL